MGERGRSPWNFFSNSSVKEGPVTRSQGRGGDTSRRISPTRSRAGSNGSASSYHSLKIQKEQVQLSMEEELDELDVIDDTLKEEMGLVELRIVCLEAKIDKLREYLQDMTSWTSDEDGKVKGQELKELERELSDKQEEKASLQLTHNRKKKSTDRKRKLVIKKYNLEKDKITEEEEQNISSDEDKRDTSVLPNREDLNPDPDLVERFADAAAVQLEKDKIAEANEKARLDEEEAARRKEEELKVIELQTEKDEEMAKVLDALERSKLKKEQAVRDEDELKKKFEQLTKSEYSSMQQGAMVMTAASAPSAPPPTADERIINLLAQVVNGGSSSNNRDNNKFLARQSYSKELPIFSGRAEEWPIFMADFTRSSEDCQFSNSENLTRLRKCLKGDAADYVRSMMVSPDNVPTIMKELQTRYGQPEHIIRAMIRKAREVPPVNAEKLEGLIEFGSAVRNFTATVKTLNRPEHLSNPQLQQELEAKLPDSLRMRWMEWTTDNETRKRDLDHFSQWLSKQTSLACEICPPKFDEKDRKQSHSSPDRREVENRNKKKYSADLRGNDIPTVAGLVVGEKEKYKLKCIFCEASHDSRDCGRADEMSLKAKQDIIRNSKRCFKCLKVGHMSKECRSFTKCRLCKRPHPIIICPDLPHHKPNGEVQQVKELSNLENVESTISNLSCSSKVILKTLKVKIIGMHGDRTVRALIDDGSQRSYISKELALDLGLKLIGKEEIQHCLFTGVQTSAQTHGRYEIQLRYPNRNGVLKLNVLDQQRICGDIPQVTKGNWMFELRKKGIWISDISNNSEKIELLIGADSIVGLTTGKEVHLRNGLMAVETVLGWTLIGKQRSAEENVSRYVHSMHVSDASVQQLWDLETLGIRDPVELKSKEEKEMIAKLHFMETVVRGEDGRYSVSLPWIGDKIDIPSNRNIAEKRLESMTKKLESDRMFEAYGEIFTSWENEGIIEEVTSDDLGILGHYIPHRAVYKPDSLTTPIRPVFDASCKGNRTPSLNECLEKGPNLLELIPSVLLRFREKKIGIIGDIRKAFQMVEVIQKDRDSLRFLWWEDFQKHKFKVYRHKRVVFGVNCSPYLLAAVLEYHLGNCKIEDQELSNQLLKSLYVDNVVTSQDTIEEAIQFKEWSTEYLAEGKMELREWEGGFAEKSRIDPLVSRGCGLDFGRAEDSTQQKKTTSVLGYKWDKLEDTIYCDLTILPPPLKISKREILSSVQKVFDPIGFTCPATLFPKLLLQDLWEKKMGWDEKLPDEYVGKFKEWTSELFCLQEIRIPRHLQPGSSTRENWQIHAFCDASQKAYSAVVFLRSRSDEKVSVQLMGAKARVAPLKNTTINRLELLGCVIAALLTNSIIEALSIDDVPIYYWSDSSTALAWIRGNDDWGTFVGNRVKTICGLTNVKDWRHVPGVCNPADLPSRGCSPAQLLASKWWEGPEWLRESEDQWPSEDHTPDVNSVLLERKRMKVKVNSSLAVTDSAPWYASKSSYQKNVRILAFVLRFIKIFKKENTDEITESLSVQEIMEVEKVLIKLVQVDTIPSDSTLFCGIQIAKMEDGLFHVNSKIRLLPDFEEFRTPIVLPHSHPIVDQLIRAEHFKNRHAGVQFIMSVIRGKFWIVQGRKAVRRVIRGCIVCLRHTAKKSNVVSAPLPKDRITTGPTFQTTGVDLAGPLFLKGGEKAWIVLFTCAVYRCVHLELVKSLSTEAFMDALSCFMGRRGRPSTIYSDNGTNFVGSHNALKELDWKRIKEVYAMDQILWKFNPPSAPWWGGFWERLVRSVKDLLKRSLGKSTLSYEKLYTWICEIEGIVNGRPLTTVTEDPEDFIPLTPAMFLHQTPYEGVTDRELLEASGFQKLISNKNTALEQIRTRFRKEYLAMLVQRGKEKNVRAFQVGEIVLIGADNKKRWEWPIARILELIPGRDGHVRVAKLKTSSGILTRPIQRIYSMEISSPVDVPVFPEVGSDDKKEVEEDNIKESESKEVRTRYGRVVKAPERY